MPLPNRANTVTLLCPVYIWPILTTIVCSSHTVLQFMVLDNSMPEKPFLTSNTIEYAVLGFGC